MLETFGLAGAVTVLAVLAASCGPRLPVVEGAETEELLGSVEGRLVLSGTSGGARWLDLPSGEEHAIELDQDPVHFSRINARGLVAYLSSSDGWHEIRFRDVLQEGVPETMLVLREGEVHHNSRVDLSDSGAVAFLHCTHLGAFSYTPWQLELIAPDGEVLYRADASFSYGGPSFGLGGELLAYRAEGGVAVVDSTGTPVTSILIDADPVLGPRGDLILHESDRQVHYVSHAGGDPRPVTLPGMFGRVVALLDDGLVLYEALPTAGRPQPPSGGFLAGPSRSWTIKVASLESGSFYTVVPRFAFGHAQFSPR